MKKMLLAAVAAMLLSVNAFAVDGTVDQIRTQYDGKTLVYIRLADNVTVYAKWLVGTADAQKAMLATLLTAKASTSQVTVYMGDDGAGSVIGWNTVIY